MEREEQEEKVASLVGGLGKVEAPAGFERHVMVRIAESQAGTERRRPAFLLFLKFAAPAAALLLMGAMFVFFGDRGVDVTSVPPVQESLNSAGPVRDVRRTGDPGSAVNATTTGQQERPSGSNASRQSKQNAPMPSGVNSEDFAVEGPGEIYTPPGLNPRPRKVDPAVVSPGSGVKVGEVLSFIGANTSCGGDGCRVASITKGSLADRAKLSIGDRIVAIDGRSVDASTAFSGPTSFKSFQVVRGGRTITVSIGSN